MSDTNDTVDGLLAEFRGYSAGMPPGYHVTMSWRDFRVMLDRLEAAHERECGNAAKLREALELAIKVGDWCCSQTDDPLECCEYSCVYQAEPHGEAGADCPWKKIRAALSAPPRNCDVLDWRTAWKIWLDKFRPETPARYSAEIESTEAFLNWFTAPATAEEGGAE